MNLFFSAFGSFFTKFGLIVALAGSALLMSALKQVLTPANFAKIEPGMPMETVRKMLGKPMKITPYELKKTWHYDWRYIDGANVSDTKIFTVVFNSDLRVLSTGSIDDPALTPK